MKLTAALLLITTAAQAADVQSCQTYATNFSAQLLKFIESRAYNYCLARDRIPALPRDFETELGIVLDTTPDTVSRIEFPEAEDLSKIGIVSVTGQPRVSNAPSCNGCGVRSASAGGSPAAKAKTPSPAEVCTRVHKRIVWSGRSWRCM